MACMASEAEDGGLVAIGRTPLERYALALEEQLSALTDRVSDLTGRVSALTARLDARPPPAVCISRCGAFVRQFAVTVVCKEPRLFCRAEVERLMNSMKTLSTKADVYTVGWDECVVDNAREYICVVELSNAILAHFALVEPRFIQRRQSYSGQSA